MLSESLTYDEGKAYANSKKEEKRGTRQWRLWDIHSSFSKFCKCEKNPLELR